MYVHNELKKTGVTRGLLWHEYKDSMNEQTWINCNIHMFEYFGGVTLRIVCDNLKTGVITPPHEGDIVLNRCYEDFSNHYCTAIMPAGVKKPKQMRNL